ncbi:MAG: hypothetical protein IJ298_03185 [Ruminococcus sp.]|nr:hypothetical protein [Ruminococcus sp.]
MNVKISNGNAKMGAIPSVSLPAGVTCRSDCECSKKCYAKRLERMRPSVRQAYKHNYDLLNSDPNTYWREVEASIMMSRFFRFHVSGDIPDAAYFEHMGDIARTNTHCEILCFTKKYDIVNSHINIIGKLPKNLHIIFSGWHDIEMVNPYNLPEAHVRYRDGSTTAREDAKLCGGNCTECAITDGGCWTAKHGEQVVFNEH